MKYRLFKGKVPNFAYLWRKAARYQSPLSAGGQFSVPNFEKERGGQKKISAWGGLNRFPVMDICLGGYYVFCQKKDF